jgi:alpha-tubulin suppressor-like RCC1 family protein
VHCWGHNLAGEIGPKAPGTNLQQLVPIDVEQMPGVPLLATAIAVSAYTSCAATPGGELYCWGDNRAGQLGDPSVIPTTTMQSSTPVKGSDLAGWSALDGSESMLCGLAGGAMYCWGTAKRGGIGAGVWTDTRAFAKALPAASQLSVGWSYEVDFVTMQDTGAHDLTCALVDAEIRCWGDNRYGQLGRGAATMELAPVDVAGDHRFSTLEVGAAHACGIEGDTLHCWGATINGQATGLVSGSSLPRSPCVATLDCDVGIPKLIGFAEETTGVGTGRLHTCALHNQVMTCWGDNAFSQLGSNMPGPTKRDITGPGGRAWQTMLPGGANGQCASAVPDETWCWGLVIAQQTMRVREPQLDGVKAIATGLDFTCTLDRDGRISCLGDNTMGQFGNGSPGATSCLPPNGVCDLGETATSCPMDCCASPTCGTPALTLLPRTYQALSASPDARTACGVLPPPGGEVECWGANDRGQGGASGGAVIYTASRVPDLAACTAISLAINHSCAICSGQIHCWGDNRFGGLGTGDRSDLVTSEPQTIPLMLDGDPWVQLDSGIGFTCARSEAGRAVCWGVAPHAGLGTGGLSANLPVTVLASPAR